MSDELHQTNAVGGAGPQDIALGKAFQGPAPVERDPCEPAFSLDAEGEFDVFGFHSQDWQIEESLASETRGRLHHDPLRIFGSQTVVRDGQVKIAVSGGILINKSKSLQHSDARQGDDESVFP